MSSMDIIEWWGNLMKLNNMECGGHYGKLEAISFLKMLLLFSEKLLAQSKVCTPYVSEGGFKKEVLSSFTITRRPLK